MRPRNVVESHNLFWKSYNRREGRVGIGFLFLKIIKSHVKMTSVRQRLVLFEAVSPLRFSWLKGYTSIIIVYKKKKKNFD